MFKTFAILSLSALALSGCVQPNGTASCAGVGAISGVALGALTDNNLAQSALAGGAAGLFAGNAGVCG
ncbi:hypothetical protein [Cypionkella sp.]|jgi:hypothetical protein|uniref:hypothetical protein n=1 Tax=Cypionkella sp. TaxID=2811411 RepID=UPI002FDD7E1B